MPDSRSPAHSLPLSRLEKLGLLLLVVVLVLFGAVVELRSAFLKRRMTDLDVYLRAAWAVRAGVDLYAITDDNNWHYHYPPLLAILLTPLADPPRGMDRTGMLPFAVSVALWYAFSLGCLFGGFHRLASALESEVFGAGQLPRGCRRWWALRLWPMGACVTPIGATLMRGQVNLLLLTLLCLMAAAVLRRKHAQAGFWLAGAICLKIIPAFLILYPLWRRQVRCLAGCAGGLVLGMGVIPVLALGPERTLASYQEWTNVLLRPALAAGTDRSRAKELIEVTATDSQSLLAMVHNTAHLDRATRPDHPSPAVRRWHWILGSLLTVLTLLVAGPRASHSGPSEVLFLGLLTVLMLLLSPVCHLHYFCLNALLVMGILAGRWERQEGLRLGPAWTLVLALHLLANLVPHLPEMDLLRDLGLASYGTLVLWLAAAVLLGRRVRSAPPAAASAAGARAEAA